MTEMEWLTSTDVQSMLVFLTTSVRGVTYDNPTIEAGVPLITPRKLRLFACACARQVWDGVPCGPPCNGRGGWEDADEGQLVTHRACYGTGRVGGLTDPRSRHAVEVAERYADGEATEAERAATHAEIFAANQGNVFRQPWLPVLPESALEVLIIVPRLLQRATRAAVPPAVGAALLRCIVGNPFVEIVWED